MDRKLIGLAFSIAVLAASAAAQTVTGSGNSGTVPVFTGSSPSSTVSNSPISVSGSNVGIGTTSPAGLLQVQANQHGYTRLIVGNTDMTMGDYGTQAGYWIYGTAANADLGSLKWVPNLLSGAGALYLTTEANYPLAFGINSSPTPSMIIGATGNVGIGTTNPQYSLDVAGSVHASGPVYYQDGSQQTTAWTGVLCGGDYAEAVDAKGSRKSYEPGDVLVLGDGEDGEVQKSAEPYSTLVAGIFATKPGVIGRRQTLLKDDAEIPMAMVGIVPTKVTAENGPIHKGDLLVTSSTAGKAMKGTDRNRLTGAVIGKAMGSLESGTSVMEVLVTLQ